MLACLILKHLQTTPAPEQLLCSGFLKETEANRAQLPIHEQQLLLQSCSCRFPCVNQVGELCLGREGMQLQQVRAWDGCCMIMALLSNLCTCGPFNWDVSELLMMSSLEGFLQAGGDHVVLLRYQLCLISIRCHSQR